MPWIPKPGALRRWRDFRRLTVPELCKRTRNKQGRHGVTERTVRLLESKKPQGSMQDSTVSALVKALSDATAGIVCHPEFLATWQNSDGTMESTAANLIDPTLPAAPAPTKPSVAAKTIELKPVVVREPSGLEIQRPLTSNAEIERAIGRHADTVTLRSGTFPVVGCDWLHELETQYADHLDRTFAITGDVRDTRPIPARAVAVLGAESGRGAAYVKIGRIATGRDSQGQNHKVDVWPTVFAPRGEHGKALLRAHKENRRVTVLVHIVIAERKVGATRDETWEGFFWYEKGKPSPKPWAFVADEVIIGDHFPQTATVSATPA